MDSQRSDFEKINLIEKGKKIGINKLLRTIKLLITVWNRKYKMKSYCLKCRKDTENINPKVSGTSNGKAMILSKCAICDSKKSRFIENKEAKWLLSNLGLRAPLSKVPILGEILLWVQLR